MRLLSVDPGKGLVGWARFVDGTLRACGLIRSKDFDDLRERCRLVLGAATIDETVIEIPQVYYGRGRKGDDNDLLDVAVTAGVVAQSVSPGSTVELFRPRQWKGSRPKGVDIEYTESLLNQGEARILNDVRTSNSLRHNVIDAIGIGLWRLGRR